MIRSRWATAGFRSSTLKAAASRWYNEDGNLVVIYNGEIYNYQDLRAELLAAGHTFATQSDTEVLLHGYEEWGDALPARLRGMFTFVIWDRSAKTLFGARDIFGIKPFYYYNVDGLFLFGSEIKSFLAHPGSTNPSTNARLPEYLSIEYIPNAETMFENVYKLPGAHRFTWHDGEMKIDRYYDIRYHIDESKTLESGRMRSPRPSRRVSRPTRSPMSRSAASSPPASIRALSSMRSPRAPRTSRASRSAMPRKSIPSCPTPRNSARRSGCRASRTPSRPTNSLRPTGHPVVL